MVLSGQHSCKVLLHLQSEWRQQYGDASLPAPLRAVRADILRHSTPLEARVLIAGNEQFRQEGTSTIPISWFCTHLLNSIDPCRELAESIALAVQKSGYKRLPTKVLFKLKARGINFLFYCLQTALLKTYGGLARFLADTQANGVEAVKNMEHRGVKFTMYTLRQLEQLMTPESRTEMMLLMKDDKISLPAFERGLAHTVHGMWCKFYWQRADYIHPDKRVPTLHVSIGTPLNFPSISAFCRL